VKADVIREVTYTAKRILRDYMSYYKWLIGFAVIVGVIIAVTDPIQEVFCSLILVSIVLYTRTRIMDKYGFEQFLSCLGKHFHTWEFQEELTTPESEHLGAKKERWKCKICDSERLMPDDTVSYIDFDA